jgi:hypothetical protein
MEMRRLTAVDLNLTGTRLGSTEVRLDLTVEMWSLAVVELNLTGVALDSTGVRFNLTVEK